MDVFITLYLIVAVMWLIICSVALFSEPYADDKGMVKSLARAILATPSGPYTS